MKKIKLTRLNIRNFKGIKSLNINFEDENVYISGKNGSGKSTIFDAFTWLLFDKNSQNQSKFEIKTLDINNNVIRADTEVEGIFIADKREIKFKKTYREKWIKKHGETEESFSGNETIYEVDDVPVKKNDYKKDIEEKLADEDLFKLLTNPLYFSTNLKWQEARSLILEISGDITDLDVINSDDELKELEEKVEGKTIEQLLKSSKASLKKLIDEKKGIPIKIDELQRSIVDINIDELQKKISENELKIKSEEEKISGLKNNKKEIYEATERLYELKNQASMIDNKAKDKKLESESHIKNNINKNKTIENENRQKMNSFDLEIKSIEEDIETIQREKDELGQRYKKVVIEKFNSDEILTSCPTCKREFEKDVIESEMLDLKENFNKNKVSELESIKIKGSECNNKIEENEKAIKDLKQKKISVFSNVNKVYAENQSLEEDLKKLQSEDPLHLYPEYKDEKMLCLSQIKEIESNIKDLYRDEDSENKQISQSTIDGLKSETKELIEKMGVQKVNEKTSQRISELEKEEREISIKIAKIEKEILLCEKFITRKVKLLEDNINENFSGVKFKLFSQQVNGGISETCEALIDGVPFSSANSASKINAGLNIIKTIGDFYQVKMPIFIDNRESVILLENVDSQVINLSVSNVDSLKIEGGSFDE